MQPMTFIQKHSIIWLDNAQIPITLFKYFRRKKKPVSAASDIVYFKNLIYGPRSNFNIIILAHTLYASGWVLSHLYQNHRTEKLIQSNRFRIQRAKKKASKEQKKKRSIPANFTGDNIKNTPH